MELVIIKNGTEHLRYVVLNLVQSDYYTKFLDCDEKLAGIAAVPISRLRRRELEAGVSTGEDSSFASLNSTVGWLGITADLFSAAFVSMHEKAAPSETVRDCLAQSSDIRTIQAMGYTIFSRAYDVERLKRYVTIFSDAGRSATNGQLCYIAGLLLEELQLKSIYHVLSWCSHKTKGHGGP